MPDKLVTRGLVLRATETKEADYILNVLTAEHGRLAVIARGARRRSSKLAAACQHLAFSELVLYRRGSWHYLDEASTIALFDGLRADLEKLSLASYFAEMAEAVTSEDLPSGEVLSLLLNSLYALDTLDRPNELVRAAFELRLLALSGYEPLRHVRQDRSRRAGVRRGAGRGAVQKMRGTGRRSAARRGSARRDAPHCRRAVQAIAVVHA